MYIVNVYGYCNFMRVLSLNWNYGMCSARERERANLVDSWQRFFYMGAAHTVIPIQRQHAHKIAISVYSALETGRCVSLQKAQRKRRHDYPDAEVARRDRAAQSSQATKNCRGSETAEARERRSTRDRERRKRRLDSESATHDACIAENVSSYIS